MRSATRGVVAGEDLEDDVDEREVDDREPEECPERLPDPVAVQAGVLPGTNAGSKTSGSLKRVSSWRGGAYHG